MNKRDNTIIKEPKVAKTIRLDVDVLSWVKEEAAKAELPYQTWLNSFLKKEMKKVGLESESIESRLANLEKKISSLG